VSTKKITKKITKKMLIVNEEVTKKITRVSEEVQDQAGWQNDFLVDLKKLAGLIECIKPSLTWRVLVCPQQPRRESRGEHGGKIALPETTQEAEGHLQFIGQILAVGPLAGRNERFLPPQFRDVDLKTAGPLPYAWPFAEGHWCLYGRYAGQRIEYDGIRMLVVNDDELIGRIPGPEGFRVYA